MPLKAYYCFEPTKTYLISKGTRVIHRKEGQSGTGKPLGLERKELQQTPSVKN